MSKVLNTVTLNKTLQISECTDGFWLYDKLQGMNLSMQAKTERDAFVEALEYYQNRLTKQEKALGILRSKVEGFVNLFVNEVEYGSSTDIPSTVLEVNI
jgi:hypothetical protein